MWTMQEKAVAIRLQRLEQPILYDTKKQTPGFEILGCYDLYTVSRDGFVSDHTSYHVERI